MGDSVRPTLVAACGNADAGDDAVGPRVAELLRETPPPDTEVVDLGMRPAALLDLLENRRMLVIIDAAAVADTEPGQIFDVDWRTERNLVTSASHPSSHLIGIADQLALADTLGLLPANVRLMGITINEASRHIPMSAAVRSQMPVLAETVRNRITQDN